MTCVYEHPSCVQIEVNATGPGGPVHLASHTAVQPGDSLSEVIELASLAMGNRVLEHLSDNHFHTTDSGK